MRVVVTKAIPEHAGLGSGTQLALAVGCAFAKVFGLALAPRDIAGILDRGGRSGIGIGAFERGGFLVDGGRGAGDAPPPITSRIEFPEDWRVVLILHPGARGCTARRRRRPSARCRRSRRRGLRTCAASVDDEPAAGTGRA